MVQENSLKNKIIIICGPTASSKTSLSIECAKMLDTEIISADSMNIYSSLNIGTAKPTIEEMQGIKHHLIDIVSPSKNFTVSDYRETALPIINNLLSRGKTPIICGGTGFYINSILYNLSYGNGTGNPIVREKYKKIANEKGNLYVYNILKEKDPISADKLHFNDVKRVIRALEIFENGTKKSDIVDDLTPNYNYDAYCIDFERSVLYDRINNRVNKMIESGLIDEVISLYEQGINLSHQCMQGIGYKEIYSYLIGEIDLKTAIEMLKINTRHYAKRQITFFKRLPNLQYLKPDDTKILAEKIVNKL